MYLSNQPHQLIFPSHDYPHQPLILTPNPSLSQSQLGTQPQDGSTALHLCASAELAKYLLDLDKAFLDKQDAQGRKPYEVQNAEVRAEIEEFKFFCGCYELLSVDTPEHATPTSVVLRAIDKRAAKAGLTAEVVIYNLTLVLILVLTPSNLHPPTHPRSRRW